MNSEDLLNYRKALGYTQEQMARALGVSRSSIKNWETGNTRISKITELACCEFRRRWKQRSEFGPVTLVYADEPMRAKADHPIRMVFAHCELYQNNEVAIRQALRLRATRPFVDPMIVEPDGGIVWSPPDLLREFDSRRHLTRSKSKWLEPHLAKAKLKPNNSDGCLGGEGVVAVALSQYEVKGHIDYPDLREWSWPVSQLPQVHETDTMDIWDLKKWRRKLKYSQSETADKLGVTRGAIQNWESERSRIPPALELACQEITRRWKQRPSFGPVFLIYTDEPMWPDIDCPSCISCICCELYPNNESAIRRVRHLRKNQQFFNPTIMEENGVAIWTAGELPVE